MASHHFNILLGLSSKNELIYYWSPTYTYVSSNNVFNMARLQDVILGYDSFSLL